MSEKKAINHTIVTTAWGLLFIWWGVVVLIDPLTIGMGALGTGAILLGINFVKSRYGISPLPRNTILGLICLIWGTLDQARFLIPFHSGLSFAILLIVIGLVTLATPIMFRRKMEN